MILHQAPISGIATSEKGLVATAGYDNQVILWDKKSGNPIARGLHDHLANQVAFDVSGDFLVTASSDYTARIWQVPTMQLHSVLKGHGDDVEMAVFSPDGQFVATASRDHRARVFGLDGSLTVELVGHTADVISVAWSVGGDQLITSSDDGTIKRWEVSSGACVDDIDLDGVETDTIVMTPTGVIIAGNDEGELIVIGAEGKRVIPGHSAGIKRLVLDADRGMLVSLSYDRKMRLWSVGGERLELIETTELLPDVWPRSCALLGDDIVFATFGGRYRTFGMGGRGWLAEEVPGTSGVNAVTVLGQRRLWVGDDGRVKDESGVVAEMRSLCNFLTPVADRVITGGQLGIIFDALSGEVIYQHRSPLNCGVAFNLGERRLVAVGAYTGEAIILELRNEQLRHCDTVTLTSNAIKGLAYSDGQLFAVSAEAAATWFDVERWKVRLAAPHAHDKIANGCAALPGGRFLSVSRDLQLREFAPDGGVQVIATPLSHSIKCIAASADGRLAALGSYDGTVALYDLVSAQWLSVERRTASGISTIFFDQSSNQFLASSYDGNLYVFHP